MSLKFTSLTGLIGFGAALAPAVDPDINSVVLLAGFNGADAATAFSDESQSAHGAFTFNNQAQLDTAQKKFGTASLLLDGTEDRITLADHPDWDFAAGQFTVEGFIRFNNLATNVFQEFVTHYLGPSNRGWLLGPHVSTNELRFGYSTTGSNDVTLAGSFTWAINTWYHIAVDRDVNNNIRLYVDGVVVSGPTAAAVTIFASTNPLMLGAVNAGNINELDGWIDEVRITKGVARYAGAFTPPTAHFPRT